MLLSTRYPNRPHPYRLPRENKSEIPFDLGRFIQYSVSMAKRRRILASLLGPLPKRQAKTKTAKTKTKIKTKSMRQIATKSKRPTKGNVGKTYNDVAQGKDNKTVQTQVAKVALSEINSRIGDPQVESDDLTPKQRALVNEPTWAGGSYVAGCESEDHVANVFVAAFNADPDFIEGLDDLEGPSHTELSEIEAETAA